MTRTSILLAGLAGLCFASPASAWCRMTTSERSPTMAMPCVLPDPAADPPELPLEWRRPCSAIALSVESASDDLTRAQVVQVVSSSIASWESVRCGREPLGIDIGILESSSTCTEPLFRNDGGNANVLMFSTDWPDRDYDPAAFAVTTVWHRKSTGEILDVDIEVNERRGPYGICPPLGCLDGRTVDLENVMTHELGHYLGLAHSVEPDATMFASAVAGETLKRSLEDDDMAGICAVYPPGSPAGECVHDPIGGLELGCSTGCSASGPGRRAAGWWLAALAIAALAVARRRR